jgi:hypothetical protein
MPEVPVLMRTVIAISYYIASDVRGWGREVMRAGTQVEEFHTE